MYCSIHQAVGIWDELRDAMEGKHHYGGHTAEIYAYRLMPNRPSAVIKNESPLEDILYASKSLVSIIELFCQRHDVTFLIDGYDYNTWLKEHGHTFDWRVEVQFQKTK